MMKSSLFYLILSIIKRHLVAFESVKSYDYLVFSQPPEEETMEDPSTSL